LNGKVQHVDAGPSAEQFAAQIWKLHDAPDAYCTGPDSLAEAQTSSLTDLTQKTKGG